MVGDFSKNKPMYAQVTYLAYVDSFVQRLAHLRKSFAEGV